MTADAAEISRRARTVLVGLPLVALTVGVASTQFVAWRLGYDPALGPPVIGPIYWPWRVVQWWQAPWAPQAGGTFAMLRLGLTGILCLGLMAGARGLRKRPSRHPDIHGTARLATEAEIRASGLLPRKGQPQVAGIIVGGWTHRDGALSYLTHTGKTHVLCLGPTRAGKTQGCLIPTLLSWPGSVIVYDPKGELYAQTAGWRRRKAGNTVMRFAPAETGNTIAWNPFSRVRLGTPFVYRDVANIIGHVTDPAGKGFTDHWEPSAANLLTGIALFLLDRRGRCTMNEILAAIDASADTETLLQAMMACSQPQAAEAGRGMLATPVRERGSIISTARRQLLTFRDPVVARNTASSAFAIDQLMNAARPVSLYIEARGEDELRLRPLVRLFLTLAIGQLVSQPPVLVNGREQSPHRHRLLLAVDEFASLGRMEPMEIFLSKSAGAGITALLLAQDYQQIVAAYTDNENITGHCQVMAAYAPNNARTAEWLSKKSGQSTVVVEDVSESSQQGGGRRSQNATFRSFPRPLLTPDEISRLKAPERDAEGRITAPGELLVFQAGQHAILATQSLAFRDPEFRHRAALPAPPTDTTILETPVETPAAGNAVVRPRRWRL
jgi:type IV secretion system protein VirD4